jgi:flagella basal body P-ring formation protein FlgA
MSRALISHACGLYFFGFLAGAYSASAEILPEQPTIELLAKATVTGARVYLADIARCSGSVKMCREITGIDISSSPAPGRSAFIQKSSVESILAKEWVGVSIQFTGNESTRVEAANSDIGIDDIRSKLQNAIGQRTHRIAEELRVSIQKIQPIGALTIRPTQLQLDFYDLDSISFESPDWLSKNLVGNRLISIRAVNPSDLDDKSNLQINVMFAVERLLPSLAKSLPPGQIIQDSNVTMLWMPMRRGLQDFAVSKDVVIGRKSRQSLSSGEPILVRYLESPMAVGRNQIVTMIVKKGDLEIAARATTVDQGAIGQTVQVVNMANKLRMKARVIDEKTVEAVSF